MLEDRGEPVAYIREKKDMYDGVNTQIRTVRGDLEHLPIEMRLHQGLEFSTFQFSLMMDKLTWYIQDEV